MQVYDVALDAALQAQGCNSRNLAVTGDWEWLLQEFASMYGIRQTYTVLAHLRWVVRCVKNCSIVSDCHDQSASSIRLAHWFSTI